MACIDPPELADEELLAIIEGAGDPKAADHLSKCLHCESRAQQLILEQETIVNRLFRATCPPNQVLGEYQLGVLDPVMVESVTAHMKGCPHCASELEILQAHQADLASELAVDPLSSVKVLVARLLGDPGQGDYAPAVAGVRSPGEQTRIYEAGWVRFTVEIQQDLVDPARRTLLGLIAQGGWSGSAVYLRAESGLVGETTIGEAGQFIFEDVQRGEFTLIIEHPPDEIHLEISVD